MAVDPSQFAKEMSVDRFDDCTSTTTTTHCANIGQSSNSKPKPLSKQGHDALEFSDTPFAQSLLPHIHLLGITNHCIQKLSPVESTHAWTTIGCIDKDIQDASYLLLDHNTKLLRCGGLYKDQYIPSVSICDLTQTIDHRNGIQNQNTLQSFSLPQLHHRRHGHRTLCIRIFNKPHVIAMGGFDSQGNTIHKSEMIAVDRIQSHIQSTLQNKRANHQNGTHRKKPGHWNLSEAVELSLAIADFGATYDSIHDRIYICGGLDRQFNSLANCVMFDIKTNKWLNLPKLNVERHCNETELLYNVQHHNPNVLMTFGGWTGTSRNSIEIFDFRNNSNKWQMHINEKKKRGTGYGVFNYPHSNTASVVKSFTMSGGKQAHNLQTQLNGLKLKESRQPQENVVIVCGHREGLFIETNYMEALEMRTRKWHTVARFKGAQNCNVNQNMINAQQTAMPPQDSSAIDIKTLKQNKRFANAFRYLTLL